MFKPLPLIIFCLVGSCLVFSSLAMASDTSPAGLKTYLVTFLGKAQRPQLRELKSELKKLSQSEKYRTYFSVFEDASQEVEDQQDVYLDRALVETTPESMAQFQERDRAIPGLRIFYRQVRSVQANVTLSVLDLDRKPLTTFVLGPISNVRAVSLCDLTVPASCFFGDETHQTCRFIDANCLAHIESVHLLDGQIDRDEYWQRPIKEVLLETLERSDVGEIRLMFSDIQLVDAQSDEREVLGERATAYASLAEKMDVVQIPSARYLIDLPLGLLQPATLQLNKHTHVLNQLRSLLRQRVPLQNAQR